MRKGITVAIPAHPGRAHNGLLARALSSIDRQILLPDAVSVTMDNGREGAPDTRQRALESVATEWVAFLDSDDEMLPQHLERLMACAYETNADYVFSYFVRSQGGDPLGHFGKVFDPVNPHQTTITTLCRTSLAQEARFESDDPSNPNRSGEDWRFTLRCIDLGARIVHLPEETWIWHRHQGNTSGLVGRGDSR